MWRPSVVYIGRIRRSAEFQALCEVYEFRTDRQTGTKKTDYGWYRGVCSFACGMSRHIKVDVTFQSEYRG